MIIYKATNLITSKAYIGQTQKNLEKRKGSHCCPSSKQPTYFSRSIFKYGKENFKFEILCECETKEELNEMEFHYIKQYNTLKPNGYNLTLGGEGTFGWKPNKKTKEKISKSNQEYWRNLDQKEKEIHCQKLCGRSGNKNPMWGKKRPDVTGDLNPAKRPDVREKISKANIGRIVKDETKEKLSCLYKDKTYEEIFGIERAIEVRQKHKASLQNSKTVGRYDRTNETKEKLRSNHSKYTYEILSPNDSVIKTTSLRLFCKENQLNRQTIMGKYGSKGFKVISKSKLE